MILQTITTRYSKTSRYKHNSEALVRLLMAKISMEMEMEMEMHMQVQETSGECGAPCGSVSRSAIAFRKASSFHYPSQVLQVMVRTGGMFPRLAPFAQLFPCFLSLLH